MNLKAIVLAAGQGKRLRESDSDNIPKVMKIACGKPLLEYVLGSIDFVGPDNIYIVVGFGRDVVIDFFGGRYNIAVQHQLLGTGNAVDSCRDLLADFDGSTLVCYGDTPLVLTDTYKTLIDNHMAQNNACTILTTLTENPTGYGRILREQDSFAGIVEERDCTDEQRKINEINSGIYVFDNKKLFDALSKVVPNNDQKEYYLTDVPKILGDVGEKIGLYSIPDEWQTIGVNTLDQLDQIEKIIQEKGIL